MKIYPSKHNIIQTDEINLNTDIPLGYINTDSKDYVLTIIDSLKGEEITPVIPYTNFSTYNLALFKPNNKNELLNSEKFYKIDHASLIQRTVTGYQYIPLNSLSFSPETFDYEIIVKKKLQYNSQRTYNLKVGCIDDVNNTYLSENLIKVFGDASSRGICPTNIWINNKDLSVNSLTDGLIKDLDFVFIASTDGKSYKKYNIDNGVYENVMDINKEFLSNQTNVWFSVDNFPITLTNNEIIISNPITFKSFSINTKSFDQSSITKTLFVVDNETQEEINLHLICKDKTCVIIKEYKNKGFVIYSPKDFFINIDKNIKLLYEVLFYIYKNSYLKSEKINQWITDTIPDYVITNNKITTIDKFSTAKSIYEIFNMSKDELDFAKIIINKENVFMKGIYNDHILFEKKYKDSFSKYSDPGKPNSNMISIYTPQKQIIYFDEIIYSIVDNIESKFKYERVNNTFVLRLNNYKNTYYGINIGNDTTNNIVIPLIETVDYKQTPINNTNFCICYKDNLLNYCKESAYTPEANGVCLLKINITKTDITPDIYDMRRRGGGLPKEYKDDYNLLDIGHIYGLAYRKAGTIVITLPTRLKPYEDIIKKVVNKHIVSEKYPVILFEDKEE